MGLLDLNWDALNSDQGRMALGLLAAAGPQERPMSFGQRLAGAMDQFRSQKAAEDERKQRAQQQALQTQLVQMQLAQAKAQQEQQQRALTNEEAFRNLLPSPQMQASSDALSGGGGPTVGNAANIKPVDPMAQLSYEAMKYGQIKPTDYLASLRKDTTPIKLGAGESLIDQRTYKPLATNPKPEEQPSAIKEYNFAKAQGYPGTLQQFMLEQKRAGATNVSVNTEKPFLTSVASKLGDQLDTGLSQARAASQAVGTAQAIKSAIDSGKVVAGPGASFRVAGLQVGQMLGIGGKDAAEVLSNTRTVIQSMAKAELDAAQQMKGQGQITEAERDIIRRAASGNIDSLTTGEVRQLADAMEKTARFKIAAHRSNVGALSKMKEAAPLLPFYQVDEPALYEPAPTAPGRVRRYNPQTGALE